MTVLAAAALRGVDASVTSDPTVGEFVGVAHAVAAAREPLRMPCPACGGDADWHWYEPTDRAVTRYVSIDCLGCEPGLTGTC